MKNNPKKYAPFITPPETFLGQTRKFITYEHEKFKCVAVSPVNAKSGKNEIHYLLRDEHYYESLHALQTAFKDGITEDDEMDILDTLETIAL